MLHSVGHAKYSCIHVCVCMYVWMDGCTYACTYEIICMYVYMIYVCVLQKRSEFRTVSM